MPTADLVRQGREKQVREVWSIILSNTTQVRRNMPYIFGNPGAGKTALLRYIFERADRDLDDSKFSEAQREWIRNVAVFAITFNSSTPVSFFDLLMLKTNGITLTPVVMRLLFAQ